jgi:hypothetical protein
MKPIGAFLRWLTILELLVGGVLLFSVAARSSTKSVAQGTTKVTSQATAPVPPTTSKETGKPTQAPPTATAEAATETPTKAPTTAAKVTPTSPPGAAQGAVLCTAKAVPVFLSPGDSKSCGVLEPAAEVKVMGHKPGWYEVSMEGWQPATSRSVVYALEGIRIRKALLEECVQGNVKVLKTVTDPYTEQEWRQIQVTGMWIPEKDLDSALDSIWSDASSWYTKSCSVCHALHAPSQYTANQWPGILKSMSTRTSLSKEQIAWIEKYLQYNAKDTSKAGTLLPCSTK